MLEQALFMSRPHYMSGGECGYCRGRKPTGLPALPGPAGAPERPAHITLGCQLDEVSCADYDRFINLGFRRSGKFLYKGDMLRGCCRMYTIRTTLGMMHVTKEHRQTVNRFKRAIAEEQTNAAGPESSNERSAESRNASSKKIDPRAFSLASLIEAENSTSRFHTRFEPTEYSDEKYALYKKYQTTVHNDAPEDVTQMQFFRFLCETPFKDEEIEGSDAEWDALNGWVLRAAAKNGTKNGPKEKRRRTGPVHECYYLDGTLIAVSVLDFLPSGVSSVYFIWDPDYAHLSLGTLLVLREIQMCHVLGLGFYYLGYYIGDCAKMRYKGKFGGELLDVCGEKFYSLDAVQRTQQAHACLLLPYDAYDRFWLYDAGSAGQERELLLSGHPASGSAGEDTASVVFATAETYRTADAAKEAITTAYDVGAMQLPAVLPGCMPMLQVLGWLQKEESAHMQVVLYTAANGQLLTRNFAQLSRKQRAAVVDFVRLFGVAGAQKSVIIV